MTDILISGDTAPTITGVITDTVTGDPIDLTGAEVFFQLRLLTDRKLRIDGACIVTTPLLGQVSYTLDPADLDFEGDCQARFKVVYSDDRVQHTVPALSVTVEAV